MQLGWTVGLCPEKTSLTFGAEEENRPDPGFFFETGHFSTLFTLFISQEKMKIKIRLI